MSQPPDHRTRTACRTSVNAEVARPVLGGTIVAWQIRASARKQGAGAIAPVHVMVVMVVISLRSGVTWYTDCASSAHNHSAGRLPQHHSREHRAARERRQPSGSAAEVAPAGNT